MPELRVVFCKLAALRDKHAAGEPGLAEIKFLETVQAALVKEAMESCPRTVNRHLMRASCEPVHSLR